MPCYAYPTGAVPHDVDLASAFANSSPRIRIGRISVAAAFQLDERPQWGDPMAGKISPVLPVQPQRPAVGRYPLGTRCQARSRSLGGLPLALAPTPGGPDESGLLSGCAVNDGLTLISPAPAASTTRSEPCLTTSRDHLPGRNRGRPNPQYRPRQSGQTSDFRDPFVWQGLIAGTSYGRTH